MHRNLVPTKLSLPPCQKPSPRHRTGKSVSAVVMAAAFTMQAKQAPALAAMDKLPQRQPPAHTQPQRSNALKASAAKAATTSNTMSA